MNPATSQALETATVRIGKDDANTLMELAALTGGTVASVFRDVCMPTIRMKLIERAESRVKELRENPAFANTLEVGGK